MSRRKRKSAAKRPRPAPPDADRSASTDRPPLEPDPPRPNKPLLWTAGILLVAWITVLVLLAAAS